MYALCSKAQNTSETITNPQRNPWPDRYTDQKNISAGLQAAQKRDVSLYETYAQCC